MQAATKKDIEDSPVDIIINKGMEQAAGESTLKDEENSRRSLEVKKKMKNTVWYEAVVGAASSEGKDGKERALPITKIKRLNLDPVILNLSCED